MIDGNEPKGHNIVVTLGAVWFLVLFAVAAVFA